MSDEEKPKEEATAQPAEVDDWRQRFITKVNEKIPGSGVCPRCAQQKMVVAENIVTPVTWVNGALSIGGASYPQGMLICSNCGHTSYFNLVVLGVLSPPDGKGHG